MSEQPRLEASQSRRVRLRPETWPKWLAITKARRWTLSEAADALADEYLQAHGIAVDGESSDGSPLIPGPTDHSRLEGPVTHIPADDEARPSIPPASQAASQSGSPDDAI